MGTGRQVDLLRTDVANGFTELRTDNDTLRTELLKAINEGLREHRDEIITALTREQQEAKLAHRDNRDLQRQLAEAREELHRVELLALRAEVNTAPALASGLAPAALLDAPAEAAPAAFEVAGAAFADAEPAPAAPVTTEPAHVDTPAATSAPTRLPKKEIAVPETTPAEESNNPEAGITTDQAHRLIELLSRLAPVPAVAAAPEQPQAVEQALGASAEAGGVADLIPAALAWPTHVATLLKAAAVNTLAIACNPHTWEFLQQKVEDAEHFDKQKTLPAPRGATPDDGDNVLSGRSVIALLNALRSTVYAGTGHEVETWALAVTCYERIAEVVNATRPTGDDQQLTQPRVVLDDLSVKAVIGEHH